MKMYSIKARDESGSIMHSYANCIIPLNKNDYFEQNSSILGED